MVTTMDQQAQQEVAMAEKGLKPVEVAGAAAEVRSLLAEMVGKHGMSLDAVLAGCRIAVGQVERLRAIGGIDLGSAPPAGSA